MVRPEVSLTAPADTYLNTQDWLGREKGKKRNMGCDKKDFFSIDCFLKRLPVAGSWLLGERRGRDASVESKLFLLLV